MSPAEDPRKYVDIVELAAHTGISISTLNRLKNRGDIPFYQPGGKRTRMLFPLDAIERVAATPSVGSISSAAASPTGAPGSPGDALEGSLTLLPSSNTSPLSGPKPRWRRQTN